MIGARRRRLTFSVVLATSIGVTACSTADDRSPVAAPDPASRSDGQPPGLDNIIGTSDALVEVASVAILDRFLLEDGTEHQLYEVEVSEVLFSASRSGDGTPLAEAGLAPGSLLVREGLGYQEREPRLADGAEDIVLVLEHFENAPLLRAEWGVQLAILDRDGLISVLGEDSDARQEELSQMAELTGLGGTDLLVEWVAQNERVRSGRASVATLDEHYRALRDQSSTTWYDLPRAVRPLDPALTPAEVLAGLSTFPALIVIDESIALHEGQLAIANDEGIAYVTELSVGTHQASLLGPRRATWTVAVSGSGVVGEQTELGRFRPTRVGPLILHVVEDAGTPSGLLVELLEVSDVELGAAIQAQRVAPGVGRRSPAG